MIRVKKDELPDELRQTMDYVAATGAKVVVEFDGGKQVGLVPVDDLELAQRVEDYLDNQAAEAALAEGGEDIPWEVVKKVFNL